jgi:hypothetical protein
MVSPSAQLRVGWVRITVYQPLQFGTSDLHGGIAVLKSGLPETNRRQFDRRQVSGIAVFTPLSYSRALTRQVKQFS